MTGRVSCVLVWAKLLKAAEEVVERGLGRLSWYLCPVPSAQAKGARLPKDATRQALRARASAS